MSLATLTSHLQHTHRAARIAATLAGVLGVGIVAGQIGATPTAHASAAFHYSSGYSVQQGWLCYGWSNGTVHCTHNWYRSGSSYISLNPSWVPNSGAASASAFGGGHLAPANTSSSSHLGAAPSGISAWANTGRGAYAMRDFGGDAYSGLFGQCTWYAWYRHQGEPLMQLGNAAQWAYSASAHGLRTGSTPAVGATAVFQGGVQGASGIGHVAHVEAVYGNGWFLVSEMNFYANGGGWGRVDYRYVHTGGGVSFIY
ncbi:MAG TPA: CHAP domain-containing protein [Ktedonobacterales bacterium]|nr:CHAP domain-containing protein [Ktedonobacterales bacterium]